MEKQAPNTPKPTAKKVWQKPDFEILDTDNVDGGGNNIAYNEREHVTETIAGPTVVVLIRKTPGALVQVKSPGQGFYFVDFSS